MRMFLNNHADDSTQKLAHAQPEIHLSDLSPGEEAVITGFHFDETREGFLQRLFEVGFLKDESLRVLQEAPFSRDPMSIRIKEATYALRREEAKLICVRKI